MADQAVAGFVAGVWILAIGVVILARGTVASDPELRSPPGHQSDTSAAMDGQPSAPDTGTDESLSESHRTEDAWALEAISTDIILLNVLVTQGGVIALVIAGAFLSNLPLQALGVTWSAVDQGAIAIGLVAGVGLYLLDEVLAAIARGFGYVPEDLLRSVLTPESMQGWVLLVCLILPLVALGEELLFRAALLGATPLVSDFPTFGLLLISSLLFGLAHAVQGRAGVVVAGMLGFGLGTAYLLTGSLLVVVCAHYVVNLLEFVIHELLDLEVDQRAAPPHD